MKLHSLMFGWEYPPAHLGGLGVACQGLVRGLMHHGVKVTLVLPSSNAHTEGDMEVRSPEGELIATHHVSSLLQPYDTPESYEKRIVSGSERTEIYGKDLGAAIEQYTEQSIAMTQDVEADIVHCHDWMTYEAGVRAGAYHRKPVVAHIHATELDRTHFQPNEWIYQKEMSGFTKADHIVAVSNYTKGILTEHYGITPDKISVVHNGSSFPMMVNRRLLQSQYGKNRKPLVLFLGRMALQKGPKYFLEMAQIINSTHPDIQFVMAGDGEMMNELIDYSCQLGLHDCMVFTGKVNGPEVQRLFAIADCFVMPSISEPFGLVAMEAAAQGTPVVISKQSGVSEVLSHSFAVDFWDTAKMADCVLTILRDEHLAMQLRSEASSVAAHLTWQRQAGNVRSLYHNILTN